MSLEIKLDHVLSKLELLDEINTKIDSFNNRLTLLERKVEDKMEEIESSLVTKAEAHTVTRLTERIEELEKIQINYENKMIMQESHSKRLRVLIHGVKEDIWEKREDTILKFENLLKNRLKIDDPDDIELVDIHRLPQHLLMKNGKRITRSIVIKLVNMQDKELTTKNSKKKTIKVFTYMFVIIYQLSSNSSEKISCLFTKKLKKRIKKQFGKLLTVNSICMLTMKKLKFHSNLEFLNCANRNCCLDNLTCD